MTAAGQLERLEFADRTPQVGIARIGIGDVLASLGEGWRDFLRKPSHLVVLAAIYPFAGLLLFSISAGTGAIELLFPLASGFALVGPFASLGLLEMSRRMGRGETPSWSDALGVFAHPGIGAMLAVGLVLCALAVLWMAVASAIFFSVVGPERPTDLVSLAELVLATPEGQRLVVLGNGAGFVFALVAMALGTFSLPLLLDGLPGAGRAMGLSLRAVLVNAPAMAVWGTIVGTVLLGAIVLGLAGLAVVLPVFAHATWRLYARVFPEFRAAAR